MVHTMGNCNAREYKHEKIPACAGMTERDSSHDTSDARADCRLRDCLELNAAAGWNLSHLSHQHICHINSRTH